MSRALNLKGARTFIFSLAIFGYFVVIDQRAWVAEAKSNIITLVCSGKVTALSSKFPGQIPPSVYDHTYEFVVDLDKKLVGNVPAKIDEKNISYTVVGSNGQTSVVDIDRVTGRAEVSHDLVNWMTTFSGSCVKSEGTKF